MLHNFAKMVLSVARPIVSRGRIWRKSRKAVNFTVIVYFYDYVKEWELWDSAE
jgi:hypothetical protein